MVTAFNGLPCAALIYILSFADLLGIEFQRKKVNSNI